MIFDEIVEIVETSQVAQMTGCFGYTRTIYITPRTTTIR